MKAEQPAVRRPSEITPSIEAFEAAPVESAKASPSPSGLERATEQAPAPLVMAAPRTERAGESAVALRARLNAEDLKTPVWGGREPSNEFGAMGVVVEQPLEGVAPGAGVLRGQHLHVTGIAPFEAGKKPRDAHETRTENHDSFDQSVLYWHNRRLANRFEALMGESFKDLVASKSGLTEMRSRANAMADTNAFYQPSDEGMRYGTSNGRWDLAADGNVVDHEAGHWMLDHRSPNLSLGGTAGAMHEGYGDAQAGFLSRDPELSEDFSNKILNRGGDGLRNANNKATISNTSSRVHERGQVFAGFMWEIGEYLHQLFTGAPRRREQDESLLDQTAADHGLMVLWTYPLFLGTRSPQNSDFVRAVHQAVDSLHQAGKLDPRIDVAALKTFLNDEATRRGLPVFMNSEDEVTTLSAKSFNEALTEALQRLGLGSDVIAKAYPASRGPAGEEIVRYRLFKPIELGGTIHDVEIDDDYLTIVRRTDGRFEAHTSLVIGDRAFEDFSAFAQLVPEDANDALRQEAIEDLQRILRGDATGGTTVRGPAVSQRDPLDDNAKSPQIAGLAIEHDNRGETTVGYILRDGRLMAKLHLGTMVYTAEVNAKGEFVSGVVRESAVICGPQCWGGDSHAH